MRLPDAFENKGEIDPTEEDLCKWWEHWNDPLLNALVKEAFESNFDIRIALEKIIQARSYYRIESSYLWPEVNLNSVATRSRFSQNIFTNSSAVESIANGQSAEAAALGEQTARGAIFGPAIQNFFQVGFDAIWELDFWGKIRRGKEAAFDEWEAVQMDAQSVLISSISEVVQQYVIIRSIQQQMIILEKQIAIQKRNVYLEEVLFNAGLISLRDVEESIAVLEEEMGKLPTLDSVYKQTVYRMAVLLGRQPEGLLSSFAEPGPIPGSLGKVPAGLPSGLLRRRPDIKAAERELAAATAKIGVAVAEYFPHISLTGDGYGFESNKQYKWITPGSRYWTIGPNVQWNIIDFGRTRAMVASANSVQRQALLQYEKVVISSLQDVEGALVAYFDEQDKYFHILKEQEAAFAFYTLTEDLFKSGLINEIELLQAENALLNAEANGLQSQQSLASDLVSLYKALGGNWECSNTP